MNVGKPAHFSVMQGLAVLFVRGVQATLTYRGNLLSSKATQ